MTDATIPQQRAFNDPTVDCCGRDAADCDCPPKKLRIRTVIVMERTESMARTWYKGLTPQQAQDMMQNLETDEVVREFIADVESTKDEDLFVTRTVDIIEG